MDALFEHFKKTQAEHTSEDGQYMPSHDKALRVAEGTPKYKSGNE